MLLIVINAAQISSILDKPSCCYLFLLQNQQNTSQRRLLCDWCLKERQTWYTIWGWPSVVPRCGIHFWCHIFQASAIWRCSVPFPNVQESFTKKQLYCCLPERKWHKIWANWSILCGSMRSSNDLWCCHCSNVEVWPTYLCTAWSAG